MTEHQQPTETATPEERERVAEVGSYGGVPMDDQELADVWTGGEPVKSDDETTQTAEPAPLPERSAAEPPVSEPPAAGEPTD